MQTIVIASQKGGSGKTTLSGHLAVEAERAGAGPVALVDTDPQGSLAAWWNARAQSTPIFVKVNAMELGEALRDLRSAGIRLVVVDTPPAITVAITKVIASSDLVIVPTRPSPHDLRAVGATVDIAENARKPLVFVLNDATPRARITGEAAVALSQHGTVAPVTLYHRVDYAASMVDGRSVGEVMPQSKSADEIKTLWEYISDRLQKLRSDTERDPVPAQVQVPAKAPEPVAEPKLEAKPPKPKPKPVPEPMPTLEEKVEPVWRPSIVYNADEEVRPTKKTVAPQPPQAPQPEKMPENVAVAAQEVLTLGPPDEVKDDVTDEVDETDAESAYDGPERRSGLDRRYMREPVATFGAVERRTGPFGRRRSDKVV